MYLNFVNKFYLIIIINCILQFLFRKGADNYWQNGYLMNTTFKY